MNIDIAEGSDDEPRKDVLAGVRRFAEANPHLRADMRLPAIALQLVVVIKALSDFLPPPEEGVSREFAFLLMMGMISGAVVDDIMKESVQ